MCGRCWAGGRGARGRRRTRRCGGWTGRSSLVRRRGRCRRCGCALRGRRTGRLLVFRTLEPGRALFIIDVWLRRLFWLLRNWSLWELPCAFAYPTIVRTMQRAGHGEKSHRVPCFHSFINGLSLQGHRNGCGFIGGSVVEFAVHHDRDRNQVGFAIRRQLHQSQSSRAFGSGWLAELRERNRRGQKQNREDDAPAGGAV